MSEAGVMRTSWHAYAPIVSYGFRQTARNGVRRRKWLHALHARRTVIR